MDFKKGLVTTNCKLKKNVTLQEQFNYIYEFILTTSLLIRSVVVLIVLVQVLKTAVGK